MADKPAIPKGTRDFLPGEMARREYIFKTIKQSFALYGFLPVETPAMENLSTLLGKYGEEGDKLLFRILNSGDFLQKVSESVDIKESRSLAGAISEKGLRYDLTVPFARYVVQHRNDLVFPFRRYQIQPVWRADRPQRGRYREFYQCDADVIGSDSLINEVELIQIINDVFKNLGLEVLIKLNNRKILQGIASYIGYPDKLLDITVAIDKIEKIGIDKVNEELLQRGLKQDALERLRPVLTLKGNNASKIKRLKELLSEFEKGLEGLNEIDFVLRKTAMLDSSVRIDLDLTLARGLDYYTGSIIEVKSLDTEMGSICGGGRYDNLTGVFGLEGVSGVGISFGAERIYDIMEKCKLFPDNAMEATKILFVNFGENETDTCLKHIHFLRKKGIQCEIYPDLAKIKKQMQYADKKHIPFVALVGKEEIEKDVITLKNMKTGGQQQVAINDIPALISPNNS